MSLEFIDAEFYFPELNKTARGTFHLNGQDSFFILAENPFGANSWRSIGVAYVSTNHKSYSCVECLLSHTNLFHYRYEISELYLGGNIGEADLNDFSGLSAELHFLTKWLKPSLIDSLSIPADENYFQKVGILQRKHFQFTLDQNAYLILEGYPVVSGKHGEVIFHEKSRLQILCKTKTSRKELFSYYYSYMIFFTLFLKKGPRTTYLEYFNNDAEYKLIGLHQSIDESNFDILCEFNDLDNFQSVLSNYYANRFTFNQIIQLWEAGLKLFDQEIIFLHLTQSIELLHRSFYQNNDRGKVEIAEEFESLFGKTERSTKWTQKMSYFHLCKIAQELNFALPFPEGIKSFVEHLTDSRNHYTHHSTKKFVWKHDELYDINRILRAWLRGLILINLKVPTLLVNKVIKKDLTRTRYIDIFKNKYSMRFENYFTR